MAMGGCSRASPGVWGFESKKENVSMCLDFVLRGSRPGELGEEGKGERKGDWIGLLSRLELFRAASVPSALHWVYATGGHGGIGHRPEGSCERLPVPTQAVAYRSSESLGAKS